MNGASVARLLMVERFKVYYKAHVNRVYGTRGAQRCHDMVVEISEDMLHDTVDMQSILENGDVTASPALRATCAEIGVPFGYKSMDRWLSTPLEDQ